MFIFGLFSLNNRFKEESYKVQNFHQHLEIFKFDHMALSLYYLHDCIVINPNHIGVKYTLIVMGEGLGSFFFAYLVNINKNNQI